MNILREFSETPWWREVRIKVISTLGLHREKQLEPILEKEVN